MRKITLIALVLIIVVGGYFLFKTVSQRYDMRAFIDDFCLAQQAFCVDHGRFASSRNDIINFFRPSSHKDDIVLNILRANHMGYEAQFYYRDSKTLYTAAYYDNDLSIRISTR